MYIDEKNNKEEIPTDLYCNGSLAVGLLISIYFFLILKFPSCLE